MTPKDCLAVMLSCGDRVTETVVKKVLEAEGVGFGCHGNPHLLVDKPVGWAMLDHEDIRSDRCLIVSDNYCPAYQMDLLAQEPAGLVAFSNVEDLLLSLHMVRLGHQIRPRVVTPLTPAERRVLCLTAYGLTNKAIAVRRNVSERTVKNILHSCYIKLNLKTRVQVAHYYFGNWHLLREWKLPEHISTIMPMVPKLRDFST